MMAALMLYCMSIALLLGLAAWSVERALIALCRPRRAIWAGAIVASCIVPVCTILAADRPEKSIVPVPALATTIDTSPANYSVSRAIASASQLSELQVSLPKLDSLLQTLWIASSAGLLGFFGVAWIRLRWMTMHLQEQTIDGVSIYVADHVGPAAFGFSNPKIIVPPWFVHAPSEIRLMVLAHERSHVAAGDPMLSIAALSSVVLMPWNLPLWWQLRRLQFAIEVDCDQRVLRRGVDVAKYGEMLLTVRRRNAASSVSTLGAIGVTKCASQLEKRIRIMATAPSRRVALLLAACGMCSIGFVVAAAQLESPPLRLPAARAAPASVGAAWSLADLQWLADDGTNVIPRARDQLLWSAEELPPRLGIELRKRLNDPQRRQLLRRNLRARIGEQNPDLAQALHIDAPLQTRVLDLLANQRLAELEYLVAQSARVAASSEHADWPKELQMRADSETHLLERLEELLGQDRRDLYVQYVAALSERRQIAAFDARLDRDDKLAAEQKERLISLLVEHGGRYAHASSKTTLDTRALWSAMMKSSPSRNEPNQAPHAEEMAQLTLIQHEYALHEMQEASRRLLGLFSEVLTRQQIEIFARMEAERIERRRRTVQAMRIEAGMDPAISEERWLWAVRIGTRKPISGQVRVEVDLKVNGSERITAVFVTESGRAASFKAPEGLWVEATPHLFDNRSLYVEMQFYEGAERRRSVGVLSVSGYVSDRAAVEYSQLLTGSRVYAVQASMHADAL